MKSIQEIESLDTGVLMGMYDKTELNGGRFIKRRTPQEVKDETLEALLIREELSKRGAHRRGNRWLNRPAPHVITVRDKRKELEKRMGLGYNKLRDALSLVMGEGEELDRMMDLLAI